MKDDTHADGMFSRSLAGLIAISAALRLLLVYRGGQLFFPDEWRVMSTWVLLKYPTRALATLTAAGPAHPTHWFYVVLGLPFAVVEAVVIKLHHLPLDTPNVTSHIAVMAYGMLVFSLASILLVYLLALQSGAGQAAALAASFLMVTSTSMLYFSRHTFPYDAAMSIALLAFLVGLRVGDWRLTALVGLVAGLAFSTYNGYWELAGMALLAHVLWARKDWTDALYRLALGASFFVAPTILLEAYCRMRGRPSFLAGMVGFAGTVTQGSFSEGWKFAALYLWDTEHLVLISWIALAAFAFAFRKGTPIRIWVGSALFIYLLLALASHAHVFVVYGRSARQIVPFLCLAAGMGLARLPKWAAVLAVLIISLQFAFNISVPLRQQFTPGQTSPLAWKPYQYEGLTPEERAQLRAQK